MGKYIRKDKLTDDLALMDLSPSFLGVRTRAKTIALQKLHHHHRHRHHQTSAAAAAAAANPPDDASGSSGSYLQLRSRRLRKPQIHSAPRNSRGNKQIRRVDSSICLRNRCVVVDSGVSSNSNPMAAMSRMDVRIFPSWSGGSVANSEVKIDAVVGASASAVVEVVEETQGNSNDVGIDTSFGENFVEFEGGERSIRETTPSSLIQDPNTVLTPGSVARCTSVQGGGPVDTPAAIGYVPTSCEVDDFFSGAEEQQLKLFMNKYNFDPAREKPLPGRFEWEKVGP